MHTLIYVACTLVVLGCYVVGSHAREKLRKRVTSLEKDHTALCNEVLRLTPGNDGKWDIEDTTGDARPAAETPYINVMLELEEWELLVDVLQHTTSNKFDGYFTVLDRIKKTIQKQLI